MENQENAAYVLAKQRDFVGEPLFESAGHVSEAIERVFHVVASSIDQIPSQIAPSRNEILLYNVHNLVNSKIGVIRKHHRQFADSFQSVASIRLACCACHQIFKRLVAIFVS